MWSSLQVFSGAEDQAVVQMVALEIDGPHITLSDAPIQSALLILNTLHVIDTTAPDSLTTTVKDVRPKEGAAMSAGVL
jgi:hypothetical protein